MNFNVSVIIPVYNAEKFIAKAIESCLQLQEVKEIVVIDDGYKDKAKEIVRQLASKNPIIKLYEHPNNENRGAGASRNLGIEKATQDFIAFLDADDFFLPNRFEKDKEVFENNSDADGCYNAIGSHFYSEEGKKLRAEFLNVNIDEIEKLDVTTVRKKVHPKEVYKGLLRLIPDYGRFSIIGITVKRNRLLNSKILFPITSMYEDTNFMVKLTEKLNFFSSEIVQPVAKRGVHQENRISTSEKDKEKYYRNKFLFFSDLSIWIKESGVQDKKVQCLIKYNRDFFKILHYKNLGYLYTTPYLLMHSQINNLLKNFGYNIHSRFIRQFSQRIRKLFPNLELKINQTNISY